MEEFPRFFCRLIKSTGAHRVVLDGQIPEIVRSAAGGGPDEHLPRFHFTNAGVGGGRGGDVTEGEVLVDGGGIQARPQSGIFEQGAKFRGKKQFTAVVGIIEGFDPERIPSQGQPLFL